jgi:hypothetical protein
MHESLYAAVGKRLTYVLNIGARAMTKSTLNVHAGHDDYHCIDDTGFFQLFAKNAQQAADLNIISHRIAELPDPGHRGAGRLPHHAPDRVAEVPERELIAEYLGRPTTSSTPTPAQRIIFGDSAGASRAVGRRQPGHGRPGREPGLLHAERRRAAAVLLRSHRRRWPTRPSRSSRRSPGVATPR